MPASTEARLTSFTELVATSIANAEAHQELRRLADEQAALRHVEEGPVLVVNADLPCVRPRDLLTLLGALPEGGLALVPAADGDLYESRTPVAFHRRSHSGRQAGLTQRTGTRLAETLSSF